MQVHVLPIKPTIMNKYQTFLKIVPLHLKGVQNSTNDKLNTYDKVINLYDFIKINVIFIYHI